MTTKNKTAAMVLIGNEILSGRTQDKNLNYVATKLGEIGITMAEARVIPDIEATIIETVLQLSQAHDYVFTSGGIGPTHDDITSASIAKAFDTPLHQHIEATARLEAHYKDIEGGLNAARLKMAMVPKGASLVDNPVSSAPGFHINNVYVLAGVPRILQAMLDFILPTLEHGHVIESRSIPTTLREGTIAAPLTELQKQFPDLDIGSYPYFKEGQFGVILVAKGNDTKRLDEAEKAIQIMVSKLEISG